MYTALRKYEKNLLLANHTKTPQKNFPLIVLYFPSLQLLF
jgi:predicted MPP superfamily phosphohydrolase